MRGNTGEIHIGSEGELLYKYIYHHAETPTKARSKKKKKKVSTAIQNILSKSSGMIEKDKS